MLPNAKDAVVESAKVRDYLLSPVHPVGRYKAAVFHALGYVANDWQRLQHDLLALAQGAPAVPGQDSPYGEKFEVSGILKGPSGREALFVTVWLVPAGGKIPRFITAYPG
jgi:hypothetical protein